MESLAIKDAGWVWQEFGFVCLKSKNYNAAYNISQILKKEFPNLSQAANKWLKVGVLGQAEHLHILLLRQLCIVQVGLRLFTEQLEEGRH